MQQIGEVVLAVVAVFLVGVVAYLAVTFAHLARNAPARPVGAMVRSAAREGFWAMLVQPLLPLFFVVGRRMGGGPQGVPVVLVHGYMQNRVDFLRIALALHTRGSGPIFGINYAWWSPVTQSTQSLTGFIEQVLRETGATQVDLVCHSMGGVVAVELLRSANAGLVRRCVTIASPHAGVAWRIPVLGTGGRELRSNSEFFRRRTPRALPIPVLSIASTHDNVAHPPSTTILASQGGEDRVFEHVGHLSLLFERDVVATIVDHITEARAAERRDPIRSSA